MRQRLTRAEVEQQRELNRQIAVLHEAAHCLAVRATMIEELERQKHLAEVGPTREANPAAFEIAYRTRIVAKFLGSPELRDLIKNNDALAELLLDERPAASVQGIDFMAPKLLRRRSTGRSYEERLEL